MADRKKRGNRRRARSLAHSSVGGTDERFVPPEQGAAAPSALQKFLLAAAIVLQAVWMAALVTMALAE